MPLPITQTFPGPIRIVDRGPPVGDPVIFHPLKRQVIVPAGKRLTWQEIPGQGREKPTYLITVILDESQAAPAAPAAPPGGAQPRPNADANAAPNPPGTTVAGAERGLPEHEVVSRTG